MAYDPVVNSFDLGPGSVIVVCQHGRLRIHRHLSGAVCIDEMINTTFIGPHAMSDAQRDLVGDVWADRDENGAVVYAPIEGAQLPDWIQELVGKARPDGTDE